MFDEQWCAALFISFIKAISLLFALKNKIENLAKRLLLFIFALNNN